MSESVYYIGISLIGLIAWLVRLDSKTNNNTKAFADVSKKLDLHQVRDDEVHMKVMEKLSDISEDVSEIKGFLKK